MSLYGLSEPLMVVFVRLGGVGQTEVEQEAKSRLGAAMEVLLWMGKVSEVEVAMDVLLLLRWLFFR